MSSVLNLRITLVLATTSLAAGALSASASAQQPSLATPGTITAVGTSSVKPAPEDPKSNDSIAAAVREARRAAIPRAVADARNRAILLAEAGDLKLGALVAIADTTPSPFFGGSYGQDGTFGPGRYCGQVSRYRTTRLANGRFQRKFLGRTRRCRIPTQITATEAVTFTATP